MSRVAFRQCDVERALRAAANAPTPFRVVITKAGDIRFEPVDGAPQPTTPTAADDEALDAEIEAFTNARHA